MDYDEIYLSNLKEPKLEVNKHFKYRHHHDHKDHTQQKLVRVKYVPKLEKFNKQSELKADLEKIKNITVFPLDQPGLRTPIDLSRFVPCDPLQKFLETDKDGERDSVKEEFIKTIEYNSQPLPKNDSKAKYQEFIQSKFDYKYVEASGGVHVIPYEYPNKQEYRQQILNEQASVASCLSSMSSSLCTNFTNDSGSYFIFNEKKVPLDYLVKHEVPFETRNENHVKAEIVQNQDAYYGPYYMVPHAGQEIEMREICLPKDKLFTQMTRDKAGIRARLGIDQVLLDEQQIGYEGRKYKPRFG